MSPRSLLLLIAIGLLLAAPNIAASDSGTEIESASIQLQRVKSGQLMTTLSASGSVQARRVTEVGAEVHGRIVRVFVDVGDSVEKSSPLFEIDPEPYRMTLAEAKAGLALAEAESRNAAAEAGRIEKLMEQNAASQQRVDKIRTQAEVARARVDQGKAGVDRARRDLARTKVLAPYNGSVVERLAHEGTLSSGAPVIVLQERDALEFVVNVPEASPAPVRPNDEVQLFIEGIADPVTTKVGRVSARVDPETRTYQIRGEVPDSEGLVKAGSYLRAEVAVRRAKTRPVVHRSAVITRDGRTFVMRVEDERVQRTAVRIGIRTSQRAEVLHGIAEGDLVVTGTAAGRIADGTRLRLKKPLQARASETLP